MLLSRIMLLRLNVALPLLLLRTGSFVIEPGKSGRSFQFTGVQGFPTFSLLISLFDIDCHASFPSRIMFGPGCNTCHIRASNVAISLHSARQTLQQERQLFC